MDYYKILLEDVPSLKFMDTIRFKGPEGTFQNVRFVGLCAEGDLENPADVGDYGISPLGSEMMNNRYPYCFGLFTEEDEIGLLV